MLRIDVLIVAAVASVVPALAWAQKVPSGPQFQVNTYTTGDQGAAIDHYNLYGHGQAVASDAAGNFVVVWQSANQDGAADGVFGQRFDSAGTKQGPEFRVNTVTTGSQSRPVVAAAPAGSFVVVWQHQYSDGLGYYPAHIFAQRYDSAGAPIGGEFRVNTPVDPVEYNYNPDVVSDPGGNFIVVWEHKLSDPARSIVGRRFDSAGTPLGSDFQVSPATGYYYNAFPAVAADADGDFVVVWQDTGNYIAVLGQRFDSTGTPQGGEFHVTSPGYDLERVPDVAMAANGDFVVAWWSRYIDDDVCCGGIAARRFDSAGLPLGARFRVNTYTPAGQRRPSVSAAPDGRFVVVWDSFGQIYGNGYDVFGQQFDGSGNPVGSEFKVSTAPGGAAVSSRVATDASGNFVVVWMDYSYDTPDDDSGVAARRFGDPGSCSPAPRTECRGQTVPRGTFRFRTSADPNRRSLLWGWNKGVETTREDLGDPFTDTDYALCVYDASANPQPIMRAVAPAGGTCGTAAVPCWRELGGAGPPVEYFDLLAASDGLVRIRLKPGAEGRARVVVGGRGAELSLPALPLAAPVTVQLQASTGECWTAAYDARIVKNGDGMFRARPD